MCISLSRGLHLRSNMLRNLQNLIKWGLQDTERFPRHCSHWISESKEGYGSNTWGRRGSSSLGHRQECLSLPSPLEELGSPQVGRRVPTKQVSIHGLTGQERETESAHDCNKLFYSQNTKEFSSNPSILRHFLSYGLRRETFFRFYRAICFDKNQSPFLSRKKNDAKAAFRV